MKKDAFVKDSKIPGRALEDSVSIAENYIQLSKGVWSTIHPYRMVDIYRNEADGEVLLEFKRNGEYYVSGLRGSKRFGGPRIAERIAKVVGKNPVAKKVGNSSVLLRPRDNQ